MVPPGTKVVAHSKPTQRESWEFNSKEGWSIGRSAEHYRCIKCYIPETRRERDLDTVTFFPKEITFPEINITDYLQQAATDIISILTNPPNTTIPSLQAGDSTRNALLDLATILNKTTPPPTAPPTRVQKASLLRVPEAPVQRVPVNTTLKPGECRKFFFTIFLTLIIPLNY